jgi:hypothetical protein
MKENRFINEKYFYIHNDTLWERIEVPVEAGRVRICVGDKIKVDEFGKQALNYSKS